MLHLLQIRYCGKQSSWSSWEIIEIVFLFKESIGRTDFDTSSYNDMLKSIAKIKTYDPDIKLYPGHGPYTSLEHELTHNQFLGG